MNEIALKLCDIQGRLFELSADHNYGSMEFIKLFMNSETAKHWIPSIIVCNGQEKNIF